jgi:hypothetical protein
MKDQESKVYYGMQVKYKYLSATNTKGARCAIYIGGKKVKEYPRDYSTNVVDQFVQNLKSHFLYWETCVIASDKDGYVANLTMGTEV